MHHNHPVVVMDSHLAEEEVVHIHPAVGHTHQVLVDRSHLAEEEDRHNHLEVGIRRRNHPVLEEDRHSLPEEVVEHCSSHPWCHKMNRYYRVGV